LAAGLCLDPLGELLALPQTSNWIKGWAFGKGKRWRREVKGEGRGNVKKGKGRHKLYPQKP